MNKPSPLILFRPIFPLGKVRFSEFFIRMVINVMLSLFLSGCGNQPDAVTNQILPTTVGVQPTEPRIIAPSPTESKSTDVPQTLEPISTPPAIPCAPGSEGFLAGVDPRGQTITWWHNHSGPKQDALSMLVAEFNSSNECDIIVDPTLQGGYDEIRSKMNNAIAIGEAPGLVVGYQNDEAFYALEGGLVDINLYLNDPLWGLTGQEQADFYPIFLRQGVHPAFDNKRLGFPPYRSAEVLFYNLTWLNELGFIGPPTTPSEFKSMACAAAKANGDGTGGFIISDSASALASWTYAFGGDISSEDGLRYEFTGQATIDSMTFLKGMLDEGCSYFQAKGYPDPAFAARQAIFTQGSTSGLPYYVESIADAAAVNIRSPDEWGVVAIPHTTIEPYTNIFGGDVMIPITNPETQLAAWIFIKWFTQPEIMAPRGENSGCFPPPVFSH